MEANPAITPLPAAVKRERAIREIAVCPAHPELRELVIEASQALARLDQERLEDLALSCRALHCDLPKANAAERIEMARQARAADGEMATFARVLEATRANLRVLRHRRELSKPRLEYAEGTVRGATEQDYGTEWGRTENKHGDN